MNIFKCIFLNEYVLNEYVLNEDFSNHFFPRQFQAETANSNMELLL